MQGSKLIFGVVLSAICAVTACAAFGATQVSVEKKGSYIYYIKYKDAKGLDQISTPEQFKGTSGSLEAVIMSGAVSPKLYVINKKTGNAAIVDLPAKPAKDAKPIEIKDEDFLYVSPVHLTIVTERGDALAAGVINITDGMGNKHSVVISPTDKGVAVFRDVAAGEISVSVQADGLDSTIDKDVELPEARDGAGFAREIKISGDVSTVKIAESVAEKSTVPGKAPKKVHKGNSFAAVLQGLVGLILIVLVVIIIITVIKSKGIKTADALKKLGVQLPGDNSDNGVIPANPVAAVDPNMCPFCGKMKDAAGNCACSITPGVPSPFGGASAPSSDGPRLIGVQGTYMGHIFKISGGVAVAGREASNDIALPNDTTASRRHATISASGTDFIISDQGSSNGTFVNGAKITEQKLMAGDEVQIGQTKFRFEIG